MSTGTKKKTKSSSLGAVLNASFNTTKQYPSITAIVENSRTQSMKETLNLIRADKYAEGKEDHTALIHVHNSAIKESVSHANIKGPS